MAWTRVGFYHQDVDYTKKSTKRLKAGGTRTTTTTGTRRQYNSLKLRVSGGKIEGSLYSNLYTQSGSMVNKDLYEKRVTLSGDELAEEAENFDQERIQNTVTDLLLEASDIENATQSKRDYLNLNINSDVGDVKQGSSDYDAIQGAALAASM